MPTYEEWIEGQDSETREMLETHTSGLKSALQKERAARKEAERKDVNLAGDCVPLTEKSVREDGTVPVKIIAPGWGSSGFYPAKVLERDGPKMFTKNMHMYWDHPTLTEEQERPERSLRDLAAEFTGDAQWQAEGPAGPGLYADAKVFAPFQDAVEELAEHIGVSIQAWGRVEEGEAEGREGNIVQEITAAQSVDFVTVPGAGGQVLQLFESARRDAVPQKQEVKNVDEKEAQALRDANAELTKNLADAQAESQRQGEALLLREARDYAASILDEIEMPDMTRERLVNALAAKPVLVDGALDEEAYKTAITEAASGEIEYLSKIVGSGSIKGMGGETPPAVNLAETFETYYRSMGRSPDEAKKLAAIAAEGGK